MSAKTSGFTKLFTSTYSDPATAENAAEIPKASVLYSDRVTPDEAAAISLSRTERNARPVRPRSISHASTKMIPATIHVVR